MIDSDPSQGIQSRLSFLDQFADREEVLVATAHENFPGVGRVVKLGPFFDWNEPDSELIGDVGKVCLGM